MKGNFMRKKNAQETAGMGAALMDRFDSEWFLKIRSPIDLFSNTRCVIGQVTGSWAKHNDKVLCYRRFRILPRRHSGFEYGFVVPDHLEKIDLEQAWEGEVLRRRMRHEAQLKVDRALRDFKKKEREQVAQPEPVRHLTAV